MAATRGIQVKLLVSIEERLWLDDLADVMGLSIADVVRQLIRREHEARREAIEERKPNKKRR